MIAPPGVRADLAAAQEFARHSDAKMTLLYMHIVQDPVRDEAARAAI